MVPACSELVQLPARTQQALWSLPKQWEYPTLQCNLLAICSTGYSPDYITVLQTKMNSTALLDGKEKNCHTFKACSALGYETKLKTKAFWLAYPCYAAEQFFKKFKQTLLQKLATPYLSTTKEYHVEQSETSIAFFSKLLGRSTTYKTKYRGAKQVS